MKLKFLAAVLAALISTSVLADGEHSSQVKTTQLAQSVHMFEGQGGTIDGMINSLNGIVAPADENTKIIAGHGNLATRVSLQEHIKMLTTIKDRVAELKKADKTLADIQATRPAKEWEANHNWNFINSENLVESVYQSLK